MHKCPMKYICALCSAESSSVIASCGCTFCSSCYNEIKSYISIDSIRCIICEEHIDFTKSLDINSPSTINKLTISNAQKKKVIDFLKVNNESKGHQSNKENDINIQTSSVDSNSSTLVNTSVKRSTRKRNYLTMMKQQNEILSGNNNNTNNSSMTKRFKFY